MSIFKKLQMGVLVLSVSLPAYAQQNNNEIVYEEDLQPGLNVSDKSSLLAKAARERTSIRISNQKPDSDLKQSRKLTYTVKQGDTLWDICTENFGDPYVWPRVWSYNTNITNPNWIYPGEVIWLAPPSVVPLSAPKEADNQQQLQMAAQLRNDAILHRNRGYVDSEDIKKAGVLRGAQKEVVMLSQYDEAYVEFENNKDIQPGDEFAAYQILKKVKARDRDRDDAGSLVEILGAVRVISFNRDTKIARVVIDESMNPIERGTMIGPVHRKFEMVPSLTNQKELKGYIIAHLDPTVLIAAHQIVFVDRGRDDGVREGNRFFAIKKRDFLRESQHKKDDHDGYPYEVLAEMRVLETRAKTSTCLITASTRTLEDGAEVEMVKGY
jgi:hypothetical protein